MELTRTAVCPHCLAVSPIVPGESCACASSNRTLADAHVPAPPARPVILIVDDDKIVHQIFAQVLKGMTGTLLHAKDGLAGLAIAQSVHPELVITDALLPKLDGRDMAKRLKESDDTRSGKVVVMTALYKGGRYRREAQRDFLVDEYLEKPVSAAKLLALAADAACRASQDGSRHEAAAS